MPTCPLHWTMPTCLLHWTTFSGLLRLVSEGLRPPQANVSAALGHIQELRTRRAAAAAEARVPPLRARVGGDGGDAPRARRARPRDPLLVADCWSEESPSSPRACPKAAPAVAVPLRNSRPMSALGPAPRPLPPVAVPPSRHMSLTQVPRAHCVLPPRRPPMVSLLAAHAPVLRRCWNYWNTSHGLRDWRRAPGRPSSVAVEKMKEVWHLDEEGLCAQLLSKVGARGQSRVALRLGGATAGHHRWAPQTASI